MQLKPSKATLQRWWRTEIRPLLILAVVLFSIRSSLADWNDVPSGSMKPTLVEGDRIFVREKLTLPPAPAVISSRQWPPSIVIIGGGAAGVAAAEMVRRQGYDGPVTLISADTDPPVDRPNLSKEYLAGEAKDDWIPLWPDDFYATQRIDLTLGRRVTSIDPATRVVRLDDGSDVHAVPRARR